jgi:hypothetical protein
MCIVGDKILSDSYQHLTKNSLARFMDPRVKMNDTKVLICELINVNLT